MLYGLRTCRYSSSQLVQCSLNILMAHHSSIHSLLHNTKYMQLLVNSKREAQYKKLDELVFTLKREVDTHDVWGRLASQEHKFKNEEAHRALQEIKQSCFRRREVLKFGMDYEPDRKLLSLTLLLLHTFCIYYYYSENILN